MKILLTLIVLITNLFYANSQQEKIFKNSIYFSKTHLGTVFGKYQIGTLEYTLTLERIIYKKIRLNFSYSYWNEYGAINDYQPQPYKYGDIFGRMKYKFIEVGSSLNFWNYKFFKIALNPQISFVDGNNTRTIWAGTVSQHSTYTGYTIRENKLGIAIKAKADIKIKKDRLNIGVNGAYRYYSRYNYNSTRGYEQINFGVHAGVNF